MCAKMIKVSAVYIFTEILVLHICFQVKKKIIVGKLLPLLKCKFIVATCSTVLLLRKLGDIREILPILCVPHLATCRQSLKGSTIIIFCHLVPQKDKGLIPIKLMSFLIVSQLCVFTVFIILSSSRSNQFASFKHYRYI